MLWRDIVAEWVLTKQRDIMDLIHYLVYVGIIPSTVTGNQTLHSILLTQIMLGALTDVNVPPAPQAIRNFSYRANAKEIMWDLNRKIVEKMKSLEQ